MTDQLVNEEEINQKRVLSTSLASCEQVFIFLRCLLMYKVCDADNCDKINRPSGKSIDESLSLLHAKKRQHYS